MSPIQLIWHDGLETVWSIVSNPVFANNITFDPIKVQQDNVREYGEWFTSHEAFRIQVHFANTVGASDTDFDPQDQLLVGASIVPIIATSNKTPHNSTYRRARDAPPLHHNREHQFRYSYESHLPCMAMRCIHTLAQV